MSILTNVVILLTTTIYHIITTGIENQRYPPPGQRIDLGGYKLHLYSLGKGIPTVVIDPSLGGIDGYFLVEEIAKFARVCIYDRAGYGWSDPSPKSRSSEHIVQELDTLLNLAGIEPPYILVGDSFGTYNVRLYAHRFPEKVVGMVLVDGLNEEAMLKMSLTLKVLKSFFMSGFAMSTLGAALGIVRLLGTVGLFELIKKELRKFPSKTLYRVKRSFYHHQHWITMWREMWNLELSARQVSQSDNFDNLPIISIKASTFFKRSILNFYMPVKGADKLRDKMHIELLKLSSDCTQVEATQSSHFVWIDEPEIIILAIQEIIQKLKRDRAI
jgi:pimeloyl-ACP methyl ester carboxylesterase